MTFGPFPTNLRLAYSSSGLNKEVETSSSRFLLLIAATWVIIGVLVAFMMRRRGHDFYEWLALGVVLGPLVVPLAVERARFHSARSQPRSPKPLAGRFDLLAGLDGSIEAVDALNAALRLFGGCVSSVTIARVLDYDSLTSPLGAELQTEASEMLASVARQIPSMTSRPGSSSANPIGPSLSMREKPASSWSC